MYNGQASGVIGYMERLGIKVDYRLNPADFFMLEMSTLKEEQGYVTPLTAENNLKINQPFSDNLPLLAKQHSEL